MVEWGQRGILECAKILDQMKGPVSPSEDAQPTGSSPTIEDVPPEVEAENQSPEPPDLILGEDVDPTGQDGKDGEAVHANGIDEKGGGEKLERRLSLDGMEEREVKKPRMTLEEYEAMLDAETGEGGYLEAGDILGAKYQAA